MKLFNEVKLVALIGAGLGLLATVVSNWAQTRQLEESMDEKIEEKVREALAEQNQTEEESY